MSPRDRYKQMMRDTYGPIPREGDLIKVSLFKRDEYPFAIVIHVNLPTVEYIWPDGKAVSTGIASVTLVSRAG